MAERLGIGPKTRKVRIPIRVKPEAVITASPEELEMMPQEYRNFLFNVAQNPNVSALMARRVLPKEEIVPTMQRFLSGEEIDWRTDDALGKIEAQKTYNGSLLTVLWATIIKHIYTAESGDAMKLFAQDLLRFPVDASLLQSSSIVEWLGKFNIGLFGYAGLNFYSNIASISLPEEVETFCETIEMRAQSLAQTFRGLKSDQVVPFLHFQNLKESSIDSRQGKFLKSAAPHAKIYKEHAQAAEKIDKDLEEASDQAWDKLGHNWNWAMINQVLSALPTFRNRRILLMAVAGIEANLMDGQERLLKEHSQPDNLAVDGMMILLTFKWTDPDIQGVISEEKPLAYLSIPRKYAPSTAIELLTSFGQCSSPESLISLLQGINSRVDQKTTSPWIITLLALRNARLVSDYINTLVADQIGNSGKTVQILLNQTPGMLWLTPDGKLHPRDGNTTLQKGFLIYTSSAELQQIDSQSSKPEINVSRRGAQTETPEPRQVTENERLNMPFTGEVCIVVDEQTRELVDFIFSRSNTSLDIDKLFDDFDQLSSKWKQSTYNRTIIYPLQLNLDDEYMKEAAKLGIDAVYINDNKLFFVLERRVAQAQSQGEALKTAIAATLDKQGQLHTLGMDESFIGTPEQLLLNNLALHLITKPLYMSGMTQQAYGNDKEAVKAINTAVASWNRSPSIGSFPKIGVEQNNCIAVSVPGIKMTVLLGEAGK